MDRNKTRQCLPTERRFPRNWDSFFWGLHFGPGYLYFVIGLGFLFQRGEHYPAAGVLLLAFWLIPGIIAHLLERCRASSDK